MKKFISLLISLCMVFAMVPAISYAAEADAQDQAMAEDLQVEVTAGDQEQAESEEPAEPEAPAEPVARKGSGGEVQQDVTDEPVQEYPAWIQSGSHWMYYIAEGNYYHNGRQMIGGSSYFFDYNTGYMKVGLVKDAMNGAKYFCSETGDRPDAAGSSLGAMQVGWKTVNGDRYYFNPGTYWARTGWMSYEGSRYYFSPNGKMKKGWLKVGSDKYYMNPSSGKMSTGKKTISGNVYFFNSENGKMQTGWVTYKSNKYYCTSSGKMKKGWITIGSDKYYTNPKNGKRITGFKTIKGNKYYFNPSSGKMTKGAKKINGSLYYFYKSGKAAPKGWFRGSDKAQRYGLGGGKVATGQRTIGGNTYIFNKKSGICEKNLGDKYDRQVYNMSSSTGYLIYVVKSKYQVRVYKGKKKNWSRIYTFTCALGTNGGPSGTFTVRGKTSHHNYKSGGDAVHWNNGVDLTGSRAKGAGFNGYVWTGEYPDGVIKDSRLGGRYTGGRVRVAESNSVWLYNNISVGTKVIIR